MVELRKLWRDVRKSCRENNNCKTCKYKDFSEAVCELNNMYVFEIERIEELFEEDGEMNEH